MIGSFLSAGRGDEVEKDETWDVHEEQRYGNALPAAALGRRRPVDLSNRMARRIVLCVAGWLYVRCS